VREAFVRSELALGDTPWPRPACPELDEWRQRLSAQSLTLVFASYYPNNAASVFGHTLLRVNRRSASGRPVTSPLLSYGINYAASAGTANPIKYALWGLAGGFPGVFSALPYYYKVREYADVESRDLWEYDLELTENEVADFVDHVWELGFTHFNYYYFTENCSYHLLTALEGAVQRINPSERVPWWVMPIDSVRSVTTTPGLVTATRFHPSLYRQFLARERRVIPRPQARRYFEDLAYRQSLDPPSGITPEDQALAFDAALDYWDFKNFEKLSTGDDPVRRYKQQLLTRRAKLPTLPPLGDEVGSTGRPDLGHGSMRYGLGFGHTADRGGYADVDVRFALHDRLDPLAGYPPTTTTEFLHLRARGYEGFGKTEFDYIHVVHGSLLAPITAVTRPASWRFVLGAERTRDGCRDCLAPTGLAQFGVATEFFGHRALPYALFGGSVQWIFNLRANAGLRWRWSDQVLSQIEVEWRRALGPGQRDRARIEFETRAGFAHNWSMGLTLGDDRDDDKQIRFTLYHYR
jgi:hypothetical protein